MGLAYGAISNIWKISVMASTAVLKTGMEVSDGLLGVRVLHLPPRWDTAPKDTGVQSGAFDGGFAPAYSAI